MIRKIIPVSDAKLRIKSKPITEIDKKIKSLAKDLIDTLIVQKDPEGIGLAAPQIGKNIRMFAIKFNRGYKIILNPRVISVSKSTEKTKKAPILEGCLSIPNYYGPLNRPDKIKVRYSDIEGKIHTEIFTKLPAQIIQHEIDHLNGVLFTDKLIRQKSSLYKLNKGEWEEIEI